MSLLGLKDDFKITPEEKALLISLREGGNLSPEELEKQNPPTLGERLADKLADVGGSWGFILTFVLVLVVWITINSVASANQAFDPFPFILLNLVLSCLAAVQAPIIMMSQNRQESKDRERADADYRTNLTAEREIRELQIKMDEIHKLLLRDRQ